MIYLGYIYIFLVVVIITIEVADSEHNKIYEVKENPTTEIYSQLTQNETRVLNLIKQGGLDKIN